jgi:hypothetical protein
VRVDGGDDGARLRRGGTVRQRNREAAVRLAAVVPERDPARGEISLREGLPDRHRDAVHQHRSVREARHRVDELGVGVVGVRRRKIGRGHRDGAALRDRDGAVAGENRRVVHGRDGEGERPGRAAAGVVELDRELVRAAVVPVRRVGQARLEDGVQVGG